MTCYNHTQDIIKTWLYKSKIDYFGAYINLYISYNAWFIAITNKEKDRDAINALKTRDVIWNDYIDGYIMKDLKSVMKSIVFETKHSPLRNLTGTSKHWDGKVKSEEDWQSLVEYWYRVRCNLFHGSKNPDKDSEIRAVKLAYESLLIFMNEILYRIENRSVYCKDYLKMISNLQDEKNKLMQLPNTVLKINKIDKQIKAFYSEYEKDNKDLGVDMYKEPMIAVRYNDHQEKHIMPERWLRDKVLSTQVGLTVETVKRTSSTRVGSVHKINPKELKNNDKFGVIKSIKNKK